MADNFERARTKRKHFNSRRVELGLKMRIATEIHGPSGSFDDSHLVDESNSSKENMKRKIRQSPLELKITWRNMELSSSCDAMTFERWFEQWVWFELQFRRSFIKHQRLNHAANIIKPFGAIKITYDALRSEFIRLAISDDDGSEYQLFISRFVRLVCHVVSGRNVRLFDTSIVKRSGRKEKIIIYMSKFSASLQLQVISSAAAKPRKKCSLEKSKYFSSESSTQSSTHWNGGNSCVVAYLFLVSHRQKVIHCFISSCSNCVRLRAMTIYFCYFSVNELKRRREHVLHFIEKGTNDSCARVLISTQPIELNDVEKCYF